MQSSVKESKLLPINWQNYSCNQPEYFYNFFGAVYIPKKRAVFINKNIFMNSKATRLLHVNLYMHKVFFFKGMYRVFSFVIMFLMHNCN